MVNIMKPYARIVRGERPRPGCARFEFENGSIREIEWRRFADEGPVFASLKQPDYADRWEVMPYGRGLRWPDGVDWSAGAVYQDSRPIHQPVGGPLFSRPRKPAPAKPAASSATYTIWV